MIFRMIFWSVIVATLTVGTDGFAFSVDGTEHRLVSADNPAFQTSQQVVSGLTELKEFCDENQHICHIGAAATSLVMNGAEWTKTRVDEWLYDNHQEILDEGFILPNNKLSNRSREAREAQR